MKKYDTFTKYKTIFEKDENNREISIFRFENLTSAGYNLFYPNIRFYSESNGHINPINEKIMSLQKINDYFKINTEIIKQDEVYTNPVFFFVYNTDNYFHFIYDTLPYLISFFQLKNNIPNLKLLMNYPNKDKNHFYPFVCEFLEILGITKEDIVLIKPNTQYSEIYISDSYTHGIDSNLPPRKEIYHFYSRIVESVVDDNIDRPKNIYVSRRSHKHGNYLNIGTNYTDRRKLINEDELVSFLENKGYTEVFTELLTTKEKILMFSKAENVIGAIGGGLCNVLFSKKETNLISINSPEFLKINKRFTYCFSNVITTFFEETKHYEKTKFKSNMRVKCGDVIGEIIEINNNQLKIIYSSDFVSGWNKESKFEVKTENAKHCKKLDNGLNSPWILNIKKFEKKIKPL